jgi:hypothetical protein
MSVSEACFDTAIEKENELDAQLVGIENTNVNVYHVHLSTGNLAVATDSVTLINKQIKH